MNKHLYKEIYENTARKARIWYLNNNSKMFPPSRSQLNKVKTALQTATVKNTELPLSPAPSQRAFFLRKARYQHFSSCSQYLVAKAKSQDADEKWQLHFSGQLQLSSWDEGVVCWKYWALITFALDHKVVPPCQEGQVKWISSWCPCLPLSAWLLDSEYHSERSLPAFPTPAPEPWFRDFALGENQTIKQRVLNLFLINSLHWNRACRSSSLSVPSKTVEVEVKDSWRRFKI